MHPSPSLQQRMFQCAADRPLFEHSAQLTQDYMTSVADQPVFPSEAALAGLAGFDGPLPEEPCDPAAMLR